MSAGPDRRALTYELEQILMDLVFDALAGAAARRLPEVERYSARIVELLDEEESSMTLPVQGGVHPDTA